jgi:hypothetical protein
VRRNAIDAPALAARHPAQFGDTGSTRHVKSGVFFTTDPVTAKHVWTLLAVGEAAIAAFEV